ncbi:MAG: helix-turn-helix domain-containing protein [Alphaproteobacteria bacterium]|nr:helix-turn-helix domain-containing protein [Alphaproteobacteria bacterium]
MPTQEWIRAALKDRGLKLKDVAQALNVPAPRVTDILKGQRAVQSDEIIPLADMLGMNTPSLLKSLKLGKHTQASEGTSTHLPVLGSLFGDGREGAAPDDLGFSSVPLPPDALSPEGLFCYIMGDTSMAREIAEGSLIIAADPKQHYAPVVPGSILVVEQEGGKRTLRQYTKTANGEDWLVPLPENPHPEFESWRFSLLSEFLPGAEMGTAMRLDDVVAVVLWVHRRHGTRPAQ